MTQSPYTNTNTQDNTQQAPPEEEMRAANLRAHVRRQTSHHAPNKNEKRNSIRLIIGFISFAIGSALSAIYIRKKLLSFESDVADKTYSLSEASVTGAITATGASFGDNSLHNGGITREKVYLDMVKSKDNKIAYWTYLLGGKAGISTITGVITGAIGFSLSGLFLPKAEETSPQNHAALPPEALGQPSTITTNEQHPAPATAVNPIEEQPAKQGQQATDTHEMTAQKNSAQHALENRTATARDWQSDIQEQKTEMQNTQSMPSFA